MGVGNVLTKIDDLLEQEHRRKLSIDMGLAGVRGATLAGAAGGALEWFNFAPTVSLSGVAAGITTGGLSFAYNRQRRKKEFGTQIEGLSECFSSMGRRAVRPNLLAPDSYVDGDMQTGSVDGKKARNIYFIGDMPVDQQQRADRFWQRADQILKKYGFAKWQGCQSAGLPALIERILDDFDGNDDFNYDEKTSAGYYISILVARRDFTIRTMKRMQDEADSQNLLQQYDIKPSKHSLLDKKKALVTSAQALLSKVLVMRAMGYKKGLPMRDQGVTPGRQSLSRSIMLTVNMKRIFAGVLKGCRKSLLIHERGLTSLSSLKHMEGRVDYKIFFGKS